MKTIIPDMIIDIMVVRVISEEYIKIKATRKTHSNAMNPICIGVSFFLDIYVIANIVECKYTKRQAFYLICHQKKLV